MWRLAAALLSVLALTNVVAAQRGASASGADRLQPGDSVSTDAKCPSTLGVGIKTKRKFCDVIITTDPTAGITMAIPRHTGASTLRFDLHSRFVTTDGADPSPRQPQAALAAVLNSEGTLIDHAAVMGQMRSPADLFDQLRGATPTSVNGIAPGPAESIRIVVPAAATSVSIVGVRLEVSTTDGRVTMSAPGRPIAIASNFRIEYKGIK